MPTHNYTITHRTSSHPAITQPQPHICYEGLCRNHVTCAKLQDSQQNFYSGAHHWNLCQTSAYLLWELVTVNTALLSQTDRGCGVVWVGWKSEKVPRYICTAPAEAPSSNVSLPRTAPRTRRRTRVSRAWHLLQWMRRYKTTKWRLLLRQMREMWRLWRHVAGLHRSSVMVPGDDICLLFTCCNRCVNIKPKSRWNSTESQGKKFWRQVLFRDFTELGHVGKLKVFNVSVAPLWFPCSGGQSSVNTRQYLRSSFRLEVTIV